MKKTNTKIQTKTQKANVKKVTEAAKAKAKPVTKDDAALLKAALKEVETASGPMQKAALGFTKAVAKAVALGATPSQVRKAMEDGGYSKKNLMKELKKWFGDCPEIRERAERSDKGKRAFLATLLTTTMAEARKPLSDGKPPEAQPVTLAKIANAVIKYAKEQKLTNIEDILAEVSSEIDSIVAEAAAE